MKDKNFIGKFGLFSTIVVSILGVAIFSYPKNLTEIVGTDGWIVTIISGFIAFGLLYFIYKVISTNNFNEFTDILQKRFGNIFGKFIALLFVIYNIIFISIGMRIFAEVIKMYLLEKTPTEFIFICMILIGVYLVRGDIRSLVKFNEIAFWIMTIPLFVILPFALEDSDLTNILPILTNEPIAYLKGIKVSLIAFTGFQIAYLVIPYVKNKEGIHKVLFKSITFVTIFYVIVTIFSLAIFSVDQTKTMLWPTISMLKSIDISGAFVERWEGFAMTFWIMFYFTTFINSYYFSAHIVKEVFNLEDVKLSSFIVSPFIYITALFPQNIAEVYDFHSKIMPLYSLIIFILIPLLLLSATKVGKKGENKSES